MANLTLLDMVFRLLVSLLVGAIVGIEREAHERPAGLRTHILVCMGSTLFTLCSFSVAGHAFDPGRITAQIVTGIGFLGAGTIMRQGTVVRGLTTAASIWSIAAIGIAVGIGGRMMIVAIIGAVLVYMTLNIVPHLEKRLLAKRDERLLTIAAKQEPNAIRDVLAILMSHTTLVRLLSAEESADRQSQVLRVRIRVERDFDENALSTALADSPMVISYSWE